MDKIFIINKDFKINRKKVWQSTIEELKRKSVLDFLEYETEI